MHLKEISNLSLEKIQAVRAKRSFSYFVKLFWDIIIQEDLEWNWHMGYICDELEKIAPNLIERKPKLYDLLINVPPGTSKSTIVTIMFPVWLWTKDPTLRVISNSYSGGISTDHATKSRDIILSPRFQSMFPEVSIRKDINGKTHYATEAGGERRISSTGGTVTGRHAHLLINDDPQNPKQADSEAHRIQSLDHTKTLSTRKVNKESTVTITVMQRLHRMDVSGYILLKKQDIKHIFLPGVITESTDLYGQKYLGKCLREFYKDGLLDPKRLSQKSLDELKVDLGTRGFSGQIMQNPVSEGGNIIKKNWFKQISYRDFQKMSKGKVVFFLDTAFTEKTENDPSGIIACTAINGVVYIFNAEKVRMTMPDLLEWVQDWVYKNGYDNRSMIKIEPKANGLSVIHTLQRETDLNVGETPSPSDDKMSRLSSISPKVESGRVCLVKGNWTEEFIEEVIGFPNAEHDEYVDVLVYAVNYLLEDSYENDLESLSSLI